MANYSSTIDSSSFFYQQKTIDGGALSNGATGRAHIGYQASKGFCFRTTANFSNTPNISGKPLVISNAKISLTKDSIRGTPNVKVYITSDNTSKPWKITNSTYLGAKSGTGSLTIDLNNETLANFLKTCQDFKILFIAEDSNTAGGRYSKAVFSFDWEYGASGGEITTTSPTIGSAITLKINPIVSTYSHQVEWGITDASGVKHSLQTSTIAAGTTSCSYTYNNTNFQYFGSTSKTASAYVNLKTYSGSTEMGNIPISFTLDIGNSAKPAITSASFSPKNPTSRNDISISSAISGLYVQSLSQICWNAACSVAAGTEIEKYNLSYTGVITGAEESKNNSASQSNKLINKSLTKSGTVTGTLTVTDKRGFTSEPKSLTAITIQPYKEINFSELSFKRVNRSTGKEDLITGTGIGGAAKVNFSSVKNGSTEKNGVKITYEIKQGTNTLKSKTTISGNSLTIGNTDYTISSAEVTITISAVDNFGSKISDTVIKIPSSSYIMHFKESSLGIGSAAGDLNTLTVGWDTKFTKPIELATGLKEVLSPQYGGTGHASIDNLFKNSLKTLILNTFYPVGSIYMSTSSTNPSNTFGGTWVAWGAGRVPVGVDTSNSLFNASGMTGGSADAIVVEHSHIAGYKRPDRYGSGTYDDSYWMYLDDAREAYYTTSAGESGKDKNLQPYITCYMWKRTA